MTSINELMPTQSVDDAVSNGTLADLQPEGLEQPGDNPVPGQVEEQEPVGLEPDPETAEPVYEPNLDFKVKDKSFTMDERLKGAITSKDVEDHLRDLHTKAYGLDSYKDRLASRDTEYEALNSKFQTLEGEHSQMRNNLEHLNKVKDSDFRSFQHNLGITDQAIINRANEILEFRDKPADEQHQLNQAFQNRMQQEREHMDMRAQMTQSQGAHQELHQLKMQQALAAPEITEFRKNYDERLGDGAFEARVKDWGSLQHHQYQRYVEPSVAVQEVYGQLSKIFTPATPKADPAPAAEETPAGDLPVKPIPNLGKGNQGTPTRKRFNTMKELRAHADRMQLA